MAVRAVCVGCVLLGADACAACGWLVGRVCRAVFHSVLRGDCPLPAGILDQLLITVVGGLYW